MALISLDDLEGLEDEQLDDFTDNPEPMDEEDSERLLAHWQAVASTHQVSVPSGEYVQDSQKWDKESGQKIFSWTRPVDWSSVTWTWCRHDATTSSTQTQFRLLIYFLFFCCRNDCSHTGNDPQQTAEGAALFYTNFPPREGNNNNDGDGLVE